MSFTSKPAAFSASRIWSQVAQSLLARAFERKGIPNEHRLACCLFAFHAVARGVFRAVLVVYQAVGRNDERRVAPFEAVKGRVVLELQVSEYGVEVGNHPANGIGLGGNLNFGVLGIVNALDVLKEILTCKADYILGYVLAGEHHLG